MGESTGVRRGGRQAYFKDAHSFGAAQVVAQCMRWKTAMNCVRNIPLVVIDADEPTLFDTILLGTFALAPLEGLHSLNARVVVMLQRSATLRVGAF